MNTRFISAVLWGQFLVLLVIASYLSLMPQPAAVFEGSPDKLLHLIGWAGLTLSLQLAYWPQPLLGNKKTRIGLLVLFIYSIVIEVGQYFILGRFFSFADMAANGAGIILTCIFLWGSFRLIQK